MQHDGMRRDPASIFWIGTLGVGAVLIACAVGAYLLAPDTPPNHFYATARLVLVVGLAFAFVAVLGLVHVGLENMSIHFRIRFPIAMRRDKSPPEIPAPPGPTTGQQPTPPSGVTAIYAPGAEGLRVHDNYSEGMDTFIHAAGARDVGIVKNVVRDTPPAAETQASARYASFNPHLDIVCNIHSIDFMGLWTPVAPFIEAVVYVRQRSGYVVTITGVEGTMRIGGLDCQLTPRLASGNPRVLDSQTGFYDCRIRQPLTTDMAEAMTWNPGNLNLWPDDVRLSMDLTSMVWLGTVELPSGPIPLPRRQVCDEVSVVRGPVRKDDKTKEVIKVQTTFISQEWWYDTGERRPPAAE